MNTINNKNVDKWSSIPFRKNTVLEVIKNNKRKFKFHEKLEKLINVAEEKKVEELVRSYISISLKDNPKLYSNELIENIKRIENIDAQDDENFIYDSWYINWFKNGLKEALELFIKHESENINDDENTINNIKFSDYKNFFNSFWKVFEKWLSISVIPKEWSSFNNEFMWTIDSLKNETDWTTLITVKDQEDNSFDVSFNEVESIDDTDYSRLDLDYTKIFMDNAVNKKNIENSKVNKVLFAIDNIKEWNSITLDSYQSNIRKITNSNNSYNLPFIINDISKKELEIIRWEWEIYWIWNQDNTRFVWDLTEVDFNKAVENKKVKILSPEDKEIYWNTTDYILVKDWKLNEKMNTQEIMDNLTVNTYITTEQYKIITNVFEKFSHNIAEDDQYDIDVKEWELKMFEVRENWIDEWMTRSMDIIIKYNKWKVEWEHSYYINFMDNKNELWKCIKYNIHKWWWDHPFTKIWEHLEKNNDDWTIVVLKDYTWNEKIDMFTLKDWQKINIIKQCDFDVKEINWIYQLVDFQKWNINNIEEDRFNNIDEIIERLDTYIYDKFFR